MVKIGIIGGFGLDNPEILKNFSKKEVVTPFGKPSSKLTMGKLNGVDVIILARHGINHSISPINVNFRANVSALKEEGCTHILATIAVGSLREEINPGMLVFPSQFIDFSKLRTLTFFEDKVVHTPMAKPFDENLRDLLCKTADELKLKYAGDKTIITVEGPRFSTKAESYLFRHFGADIINMSTSPEVALANELKIPYQTIAMSTDYDCWKDDEEPVTFEMILKIMKENAENVINLMSEVVKKIN